MKSGIYRIVNLKNGKFYIGSTNNLYRRKKDHFTLLKKGKNHCKILQRAYDKYGELNFVFEVLAYCPKEYLFKLEQWFVDNLKPQYNVCLLDVSVPVGLNHQKYSDKSKYSKLAKERLKQNSNFGWKSQSIESFDENGIIKRYNSLKEFAQEHKCSIGNVGKALKKGNKCKGFNIRYSR
jgi:group I intron endonuclease